MPSKCFSWRQQWSPQARLLAAPLTRSRRPFPRTAPPPGFFPAQLPVFWPPRLHGEPGGPNLHHWHSTVRAGDLLRHHHSPFWTHGLLTWSKRSCSAVVFFDLVLQGEPGAGVAGFGGVELLAERGQGACAAGGGGRVGPDVRDAAWGGDVAAGGQGFAGEGVRLVAGAGG